MGDIAAFLLARADELDEQARILIGWYGARVAPTTRQDAFWAAALRQLVKVHQPVGDHGRYSGERGCDQDDEDCGCTTRQQVCAECRDYAGDCEDAPCTTIRLLVAPYVEHPDYDPNWSPTT